MYLDGHRTGKRSGFCVNLFHGKRTTFKVGNKKKAYDSFLLKWHLRKQTIDVYINVQQPVGQGWELKVNPMLLPIDARLDWNVIKVKMEQGMLSQPGPEGQT